MIVQLKFAKTIWLPITILYSNNMFVDKVKLLTNKILTNSSLYLPYYIYIWKWISKFIIENKVKISFNKVKAHDGIRGN